MAEFERLQRYRDIVDDWSAFEDALRRPLPVCLWTNTLFIRPEALQARLAGLGVGLTPLPWLPGAFRVAEGARPGLLMEYAAGLFHLQEEVSLLPPVLLEPRPGERILDTCAAPGNKTAQIAVALANTGTVVANDRNFGRRRALRTATDRLGLLNVSTAGGDAASLPRRLGAFDRVLADVPCSCEGTTRKSLAALRRDLAFDLEKLPGVQEAILLKAAQLCRPGGRIVYATCTYAPEENEGVVDAVLRRAEGWLRLLPARVPGLRSAEGLTHWAGRRYDESLRTCLRVWPHHNDSGGFFVAVLEKDSAAPAPTPAPALEEAAPVVDGEPWLARLRERFGLPESATAGLRVVAQGTRALSVVPADHRPAPQDLCEAWGAVLFRIDRIDPKPSTGAIRALGARATRNRLDVDAAQAVAYLRREPLFPPAAALEGCTPGFVIVAHEGVPLGVARLRRAHEPGESPLENMAPKAWALPPEREAGE